MSDPRVSSLLHRLGGLYRDPSRIDRDASAVLRSSVGQHLQPTLQSLVENDGTSSKTLCLQGTIAMHFRGNTYQLLVDIYIPSGYPVRPPVAYVRLGAPNMYLKERHAHVGSDGCVYLPYLHEWKPHTHNLVELVVAMSSVFSADPPVFTRNTTSTSASSSTSSAAASRIQLSREDQRQVQQQVAREVEEANQAAAAVREAERLEAERAKQLEAQRAYDAKNLHSARQRVNDKISSHLRDLEQQTKKSLSKDLQAQRRLEQKGLAQQIDFLKSLKTQLQRHIETVESATLELNESLAQQQKEQANLGVKEKSIDEICVAASPQHQQMLQLEAENMSLTDALYFLDEALQRGSIDLTTHLKHVRQLAKRQFLARAHAIKIAEHVRADF